MIFRNYQEIAKAALRLNKHKPHLAAADVGVDPTDFSRVLAGAKPDVQTTYRFLIYHAYLDYKGATISGERG